MVNPQTTEPVLSELKVSLIGDQLIIYRDLNCETIKTSETLRQKNKNMKLIHLGEHRESWKKDIKFRVLDEEQNKILYFHQMTDNQVGAVELYREIVQIQKDIDKTQKEIQIVDKCNNIETLVDHNLSFVEYKKTLDDSLFSLQESLDDMLRRYERFCNNNCENINGGFQMEVSKLESEEEPLYLVVFTIEKKLYFVYGKLSNVFNNLLKFSYKIKKIKINKEKLIVQLWMRFTNLYNFDVSKCSLMIGDLKSRQHVPVICREACNEKIKSNKYLVTFYLPTALLADYSQGENSPVKLEGNSVYISLDVNEVPVKYRLKEKPKKRRVFGVKHNEREAWVPTSSVFSNGFALHIRRNFSGVYVLFKRAMYPIEYDSRFRILESKPISFCLFQIGRALNHIPKRKKVALFFEKQSEKAEEGAFELCEACSDSERTRCYFVIDEHSEDYKRVKNSPVTVKKFSFKYYWLLYNVNYFISTEAPIHLNLLNSNNRYIRWNSIRHPFIFLQHGITYLKRQGKRSTYIKGKAGQCSYIVVSSEKEKQVVSKTFQIKPSRVWVTGMLIFDDCEYKKMNQESPDKITIMLTWKPYEESLDDYEQSTYFKYTLQVYQMLLNYVDRSQINVVAHPRAYDLLKSTSLSDLVWDKPISEVLKESKLLITDYSSVCWNSFYQGGGVVFYQPDLEKYEDYVGKLIPEDDEYIGYRVFDSDSLNDVLQHGLSSGKVNLSYFRNDEFERIYDMINEFHDGNNTARIKQALKEKKFV